MYVQAVIQNFSVQMKNLIPSVGGLPSTILQKPKCEDLSRLSFGLSLHGGSLCSLRRSPRHVFTGEGFDTPTDKRYCINGTVLKFIPAESDSKERSEKPVSPGNNFHRIDKKTFSFLPVAQCVSIFLEKRVFFPFLLFLLFVIGDKFYTQPLLAKIPFSSQGAADARLFQVLARMVKSRNWRPMKSCPQSLPYIL